MAASQVYTDGEIMSSNNNESSKTIYTSTQDLLKSETALLFQRFNYFLLGTSFLIAAFAAVIIAINSGNTTPDTPKLTYLAYIINMSGIWLSWTFAVINLLSVNVTYEFSSHLQRMELSLFNENILKTYPYTTIGEIQIKDQVSPEYVVSIGARLCILVQNMFYPKFRLTKKGKKAPLNHTWIIPAAFMILWAVIWIFVLPGKPSLSISNWNWSLVAFTVIGWSPILVQIPGCWYWISEERRERLKSKIKNYLKDTFTI